MAFLEWIKKIFIDDLFIGMDWGQFIPSLFATFVGIFVPFLVQKQRDKSNRIDEAIQNLNNVKLELSSIKDKIDDISKNKFEDVNLSPIKTPVWNGLLSSNGILLFSELHKHILELKNNGSSKTVSTVQEKDWYERIFLVYSGIDEYNQWWNLYSDKIYSGIAIDNLKNVEQGIVDLSEDLCKDSSLFEPGKIPLHNIPYLIILIEKAINDSFLKKSKKSKNKKHKD